MRMEVLEMMVSSLLQLLGLSKKVQDISVFKVDKRAVIMRTFAAYS